MPNIISPIKYNGQDEYTFVISKRIVTLSDTILINQHYIGIMNNSNAFHTQTKFKHNLASKANKSTSTKYLFKTYMQDCNRVEPFMNNSNLGMKKARLYSFMKVNEQTQA